TPGTDADLVLPEPGGARLSIDGAVSNPLNDGTTIPDKRTAPVTGSAGAGGLTPRPAGPVPRGRPGPRAPADPPAPLGGGRRRAQSACGGAGRAEEGIGGVPERRDPGGEAEPPRWPKFKVKINPDRGGSSGQAPPPASPDKGQR